MYNSINPSFRFWTIATVEGKYFLCNRFLWNMHKKHKNYPEALSHPSPTHFSLLFGSDYSPWFYLSNIMFLILCF